MDLASKLKLPPNVGLQREVVPGKGEGICIFLGVYEIEAQADGGLYSCRVTSSGSTLEIQTLATVGERDDWLFQQVRKYEGFLEAGD